MTLVSGKHPSEVLDYAIDWTEELGGDTIVTSTAIVTGATKNGDALDGYVQSVVISGGTLGQLIKFVGVVTTTGGRTARKLVVIPYDEPLSIELVKQHLKIEQDETEDDELLGTYIIGARQWIENESGHVLVRRSLTHEFDRFATPLKLYKEPVVSIDQVSYFDRNEIEQDYANPVVRLRKSPARIYPAFGGCWPALSCRGGVTVTFTAGYDEGEVPATLQAAMLLIIGNWYRNREAVVVGSITGKLPMGVEALLEQERQRRL